MLPGRGDDERAFDPFDEFEDEDEFAEIPEPPPPTDPTQRKHYELAKNQLQILLDPRFRQALIDFRLEDPGKLVRRLARRLREGGYLLDPARLMLGTLARIAMLQDEFDGSMARPAWIDERIDETIQQLLTQDIEDERAGLPVNEPMQARFEHLVKGLQIAPARARATCIRIHELPPIKRRVFFEIVCLLEPVRKLVEVGLGSKKQVTTHLREALEFLESGDLGFRIENFHQGTGKPLDLLGGFDA